MEERICKICGKVKDLDNDFPLNGVKGEGRRWQCKECMKKINRNWRKKNKDKVSQYNKQRKKS